MKKLFQKNRRWLGAALALSGAGLVLLHWVDYGVTIHFPVEGLVIDHGVVGLLLFIVGAILGLGKPGENARKD